MIQKSHFLNQDMRHISVHVDLFLDSKISLSFSKKKPSSPLLFAELKDALGAMNVTRSQAYTMELVQSTTSSDCMR